MDYNCDVILRIQLSTVSVSVNILYRFISKMSYSENHVENTNEDIHMEVHENPRNLVDKIDVNHIRVERNNIQIDPLLVDQVIPAGREDPAKEKSPIPILVEQVIPAGREESRVKSPILDDGDSNQPVEIDMTNAVESVLDRMVKRTNLLSNC